MCIVLVGLKQRGNEVSHITLLIFVLFQDGSGYDYGFQWPCRFLTEDPGQFEFPMDLTINMPNYIDLT